MGTLYRRNVCQSVTLVRREARDYWLSLCPAPAPCAEANSPSHSAGEAPRRLTAPGTIKPPETERYPRMKLECLQENVAEGLSVVGRVVPNKSTLPVLSDVLLKTRDDGL